MQTGRVDVHAHLLPGIDDGCKSVAESIFCARALAQAGYTHAFCTPHVWPNLSKVSVKNVPLLVAQLQSELDKENVAIKLIAGGEINLTPGYSKSRPADVVTYAMAGKYALFDLWAETLPDYFEPSVKWFQALGLQPVLAHPERMRAVQDEPELADYFSEIGLFLQGNLQCFSDAPHTATNRTALRFLAEDRYFMLGSDLHNAHTLPCRIEGLERVRERVGDEKLNELTITHPRLLLPSDVT